MGLTFKREKLIRSVLISSKLSSKFAFLFYLFFTVLIISEFLLRSATDWIPSNLVEHLSPNAIKKVYETRGPITDEDTFIYHYLPFQQLKYNQYIKIDELGYRNSKYNQKSVNTVLLGDSITFARGSMVDLGDLFREDGRSFINLSMGGYSVQHYKAVYEKYIINRNIKHNNLIICVFSGNDFDNSLAYPYTFNPKGQGKNNLPWTINIIIGSFKIIKEKFLHQYIYDSKYTITLPYKDIEVNYLWYPGATTEKRMKTFETLNELASTASRSGVKVKIVLVPSPASVYGYELFEPFDNYYNTQVDLFNGLKEALENIDEVEYYDPTIDMASAVMNDFIYLSDSETHFNTKGTKIFYKLLNENFKWERE